MNPISKHCVSYQDLHKLTFYEEISTHAKEEFIPHKEDRNTTGDKSMISRMNIISDKIEDCNEQTKHTERNIHKTDTSMEENSTLMENTKGKVKANWI